jgi:SagB-type dehydrogenase family enzyme
MSKRPLLFRRAPFVVSYWDRSQLTFENYATGERIIAAPLTATILDFFDTWRSTDELARGLSDYTPASLRAAVGSLERHTLLLRSDRAEPPRTAQMSSWTSWHPAAGFFHFSTKDARYSNAKSIDRRLSVKARHSPAPPAVKHYAGADCVKLPSIDNRGDFSRILLSRRTWRQFSKRELSTADLSTMLGLTWGVQGWFKMPAPQAPLAMKTAPSGGARHAIEVYVLARRVHDLRPGTYHYQAGRHCLELLRPGADRRQIARYLPTQWWFESAAALMIMTAIFPRVQWKYEASRAYRMVLIEAGHLCQTFCLTATWLGLGPFCTMSLADSKIERDLGIDGVTESVVYVAGVGARPRDGKPM